MVMIFATTYFSNNVMIRHQVTLGRVLTLMDHPRAITIPPEADLLEVRSPNQVYLVPDRIIFNINRAFVPRPPMPTKHGLYERDEVAAPTAARRFPSQLPPSTTSSPSARVVNQPGIIWSLAALAATSVRGAAPPNRPT